MTTQGFEDSLANLGDTSVYVSAAYEDQQVEDPAIQVSFSDGSRLRADYWRVIKDGKEAVSSFDHRQKYGLPALIDAISDLRTLINDCRVTEVRLNIETGDLSFRLSNAIHLQIFGFTHYEAWEIHFPNGTGEYSNYCK